MQNPSRRPGYQEAVSVNQQCSLRNYLVSAAGAGSKRRHKKQIISEVKELIHPSCLGLAVDSILDHGTASFENPLVWILLHFLA